MASAIVQPYTGIAATSADPPRPLERLLVVDELPPGTAERLAGRYGSLFSVPEYFEVVDKVRPSMLLELSEPDHLLALTRRDHSVEVLNKVIDIDAEAVSRSAETLFASLPDIRRLALEVKFSPPRHLTRTAEPDGGLRSLFRRPLRILHAGVDHVIDHPDGSRAYLDTLGPSTRRNLAKYANRLSRRAAAGIDRTTIFGSEIGDEWFDRIVQWNSERISSKGQEPYYVAHPQVVAQLKQLAATYGVVDRVEIDGRTASAYLSFYVGHDAWIYLGSFDRSFEREHLGLLGLHWAIAAAADRGMRRTHLLWGDALYKQRLGALPVTAYRIAVYRSRIDSLIGRPAWRDMRAAWRLRLADWELPARLAYAVRRRLPGAR